MALLRAKQAGDNIVNMTGYVKLKILEYEETKLTGDELWGAFKEDFQHFTDEHFAKCSPAYTGKLRKHLRSHGVWVQNSVRINIVKSLFNTVQEQDPATWADNEPVSTTTPVVPTFPFTQIPPPKPEQIQEQVRQLDFGFGQERKSEFGFGKVLTNLAKIDTMGALVPDTCPPSVFPSQEAIFDGPGWIPNSRPNREPDVTRENNRIVNPKTPLAPQTPFMPPASLATIPILKVATIATNRTSNDNMKVVKEMGLTFERERTSSNPKQSPQWDSRVSVSDLAERIGKILGGIGVPVLKGVAVAKEILDLFRDTGVPVSIDRYVFKFEPEKSLRAVKSPPEKLRPLEKKVSRKGKRDCDKENGNYWKMKRIAVIKSDPGNLPGDGATDGNNSKRPREGC